VTREKLRKFREDLDEHYKLIFDDMYALEERALSSV